MLPRHNKIVAFIAVFIGLYFLLLHNIFPTIIPNVNIEDVISIKCPTRTISGNSGLGAINTIPKYKYIKHILATNAFFVLNIYINGITKIPNKFPRISWKGNMIGVVFAIFTK